MNFFNRLPIAQKLFLTVLSVSSFVTLILTAGAVYFDVKNERGQREATLQNIERSTLESLASSLYNFDESLTNTIADGVLKFPDVAIVRLQSEEGKELFYKKNEVDVPWFLESSFVL